MSALRTGIRKLFDRVLDALRSRRAAGQVRRARPSFRPEFDVLEARDTPSAMAIGLNIEQVKDYDPAWMFTDVFKASRAWTSMAYNTATRIQTDDMTPVLVNDHDWPTQLQEWTNSSGQLIQQRLRTQMFNSLDTQVGRYPAGIYTAW